MRASSTNNSSSMAGGRDVITDIDNTLKDAKEQHSFTIIAAMSKIQRLYAIEESLDEPLPRDVFADEDRIRFFWSGFVNSNKTKTWIDIVLKSIFHWEFFFILIFSTIIKFYALKDIENSTNIAFFFIGYATVIIYAFYLMAHYKYYIFGLIASRMMFYLMFGRFVYLIFVASVTSFIFLWIFGYFSENTDELYSWSEAIFNFLNFFKISPFYDTNALFYFLLNDALVLLKENTNNMIIIFVIFGILPFFTMLLIKKIRTENIKKQIKKYEKG